jgi:hypothetical protein
MLRAFGKRLEDTVRENFATGEDLICMQSASAAKLRPTSRGLEWAQTEHRTEARDTTRA